jgi:hypothetical protein
MRKRERSRSPERERDKREIVKEKERERGNNKLFVSSSLTKLVNYSTIYTKVCQFIGYFESL